MNYLELFGMILMLSSFEQVNTERAIRHAIQDRLPIVVVMNKVNTFHLMLYISLSAFDENDSSTSCSNVFFIYFLRLTG